MSMDESSEDEARMPGMLASRALPLSMLVITYTVIWLTLTLPCRLMPLIRPAPPASATP